MFRKKALLVKVVDAKDTPTETEESPKNPPEVVAIELMKEAKKTVCGVVAFVFVASAAREIAIHAAKTQIK